MEDGKFVVVLTTVFRLRAVTEAHSGSLGGHFGFNKTLEKLRQHYWWPNMKQDVAVVMQVVWIVNWLFGRTTHRKRRSLARHSFGFYGSLSVKW